MSPRRRCRAPLRIDALEDRAVPVGDLDFTFSADGKATAGFVTRMLSDEQANALAVQPDGKLVVAGTLAPIDVSESLAVYRYLPDGTLDPTFGTHGKVVLDVGRAESANAVAIQPDGKIVLAGEVFDPAVSRFRFLLVRLNADGTPDATFNGDGNADGVIITAVLGDATTHLSSQARGVAIQADGRIVLAGETQRDGAHPAFAVVRYTSTGAIDAGFGTDGRQVFDFGGGGTRGPEAAAAAIGIDSAGRLVVGGRASGATNFSTDFAVARLDPVTGAFDNTFDTDGKATASLVVTEEVTALAFDGSAILAAGNVAAPAGTGRDFAVVRFTELGVPDTAFNDDGIATVDFGSGTTVNDWGWGVAVAGGHVVLGGQSEAGGGDINFAAARLDVATGAIDTTFDGDGKAVLDFGGEIDFASALAIVGGKVVLAGTSSNNNNDFALARLNSDGAPDPTFGTDGRVLTHFGIMETPREDVGRAVLALPDGRVVVAGHSSREQSASFLGEASFALARFHRDGTLDPTFGDGGTVRTEGTDGLNALAAYPGGRLLVAGQSNGGFLLARYDADGNLDSSFDEDGLVETNFFNAVAKALTVLPDGRIVAVGDATGEVAVARYLANGALDISLDFDGKRTDAAGIGPVVGVTVDAAGRITVAGETGVVRYLASGARDLSFDGDGHRASPFAAGSAIRALVAQADDKLVLAARESNGTDDDFALARLNLDGALDTTGFGTGGLVRTDFNSQPNHPAAIRLQADGKIVVAGQSNLAGGTNAFAMARYLTNGDLDNGFGVGGQVMGGFGSPAAVAGLFVQPNGKINLAGSVGPELSQDFFVLQFRGDNTPPTTPGVADFSVSEGAPPRIFNLRDLFDDAQDTDVELQFEVENTNPLIGTSLDDNDVLTLTFPASGAGSAIITLKATDLDGAVTTDSFTVTVTSVNNPPSFTAGPDQSADEDAGPQSVPGWATDISPGPGEIGQGLTFLVVSNTNPGLFAAGPAISPTGELTYTPAADAFGEATITIVLRDDGGTANGGIDTSDPQSFAIAINAVNDAPSFAAGPDQSADEDAGPQSVPSWATGRSAGPANEGTQTLSFEIVSNTNPALFAAGPTVSPTGELTYTPAANAHGSATIEVRIRDDGGTANGGIDASAPQSFTITVHSVNDDPVAADDAANVNPGTPVLLDILGNDTDADGDLLSVLAFTQPAGGTVVRDGTGLRYTPNLQTMGADSFTYTVSDGKGGMDTATVNLSVVAPFAPVVREVRLYYGPNRFELLTSRVPILGWSRINRIALVFDQPVSVALGDLTLTGLGGPVALGGFAYNAVTRTATWTLAQPLGINRLTMVASGTGIVGQTNGLAMGADLVRRFAVLPGDLDGNGIVTLLEANTVKRNIGRRYPNPVNADINGDGTVTNADYLIAKGNVGKRV
jgi:uncharacterized delta-60 repeat protein